MKYHFKWHLSNREGDFKKSRFIIIWTALSVSRQCEIKQTCSLQWPGRGNSIFSTVVAIWRNELNAARIRNQIMVHIPAGLGVACGQQWLQDGYGVCFFQNSVRVSFVLLFTPVVAKYWARETLQNEEKKDSFWHKTNCPYYFHMPFKT